MRRVLFLFVDGVGLGEADPHLNPLVAGQYPTLMKLTGGKQLTSGAGRYHTAWADMIPLDACLGVEGRPQSATGQASLLTGLNAPAAIGQHYGPRPDERIRALVRDRNLFHTVRNSGLQSGFCNAYPPGFFASVARGKRLLSVIQYAAHTAGIRLHGGEDLRAGRALSADYTNGGWRERLRYDDAPIHDAERAGRLFWTMAEPYSFYLHDHWIADELGHHQDFDGAVANFQRFDGFLAGLLSAADLTQTLIIVVADHGNAEDCSHSRHTLNPALCMLIGNREGLPIASMKALTDVAPVVLQYLCPSKT